MIFDKEDYKAFDPELWNAIDAEAERQQNNIELIASENVVSKAVMAAQGTLLTNKYAEGYPGKRYYGGTAVIDVVETLAIERAKKLFGAKFANVQPHSGSQANAAVYMSLIQPGDTVMGMDLSAGGHLTHGAPVSFSGKTYNFVSYNVDKESELLDYDAILAQAKEVNDGIGIDVAATLVNKKELVANVMDAYNVVEIDNDYVENVIYYGKGAGRYVTASAVVSDIIKTAQTEKWQHDYEDCPNIYPITKSKYYIRANKPLDVDYEMYFTEKHDHIYITHEIELANLTTDIGDEEYIIFKVRG